MTTDFSDAAETTTNQFFTFTLDNGNFALHVESIREVLELPAITRIPRSPKYMRGVINLRGNAVPVVDMRRKFGMPEAKPTVDTCIIIIEVIMEGERSNIGALVDSVSEVVDLPPEHIEPAPRMGTAIRSDFIKGIGSINNDFVIILDIQKVFSLESLTGVAESAA